MSPREKKPEIQLFGELNRSVHALNERVDGLENSVRELRRERTGPKPKLRWQGRIMRAGLRLVRWGAWALALAVITPLAAAAVNGTLTGAVALVGFTLGGLSVVLGGLAYVVEETVYGTSSE